MFAEAKPSRFLPVVSALEHLYDASSDSQSFASNGVLLLLRCCTVEEILILASCVVSYRNGLR